MNGKYPDFPDSPGVYPPAEPETCRLDIPEEVWRSAEVVYEDPPAEDEFELDEPRTPMSRNAVGMIGGVATSLVAGVIPGFVVAPPASLVSGVAAGIFGGLMGISLANEFYDRRHS